MWPAKWQGIWNGSWFGRSDSTEPASCSNAHPDLTPLCSDGSHETGGTWVQAPYPDCTWTYVGGVCPVIVNPPIVPILPQIFQTYSDALARIAEDKRIAKQQADDIHRQNEAIIHMIVAFISTGELH